MPYYTSQESQDQIVRATTSKKTAAWEVLGLNASSSHLETSSLQDEVRKYHKMEAQSSDEDIVAFWQVGVCYLYLFR